MFRVRSKAFGMTASLEGNVPEKTVRSYTASLPTLLSEYGPESSQGFFFLLLLVLGGLFLLLLALGRSRCRCGSRCHHHGACGLQSFVDVNLGQCCH